MRLIFKTCSKSTALIINNKFASSADNSKIIKLKECSKYKLVSYLI